MPSRLSTPWMYVFAHVCTGACCVYNPMLWFLVLFYQFGQYIFDVRVFLFSLEIQRGNSFLYTSYKLLQYAIGVWAVRCFPAEWASGMRAI